MDNLVTEEELPESEREKFMVILIADVVPFFLVSVQFGSFCGVTKFDSCLRCGVEQAFLKDLVGKERKKVRDAKQARKKALEDMSKDLIEGFQNMKFYKFYPIKSEKYPDISEMKVC